MINRVILQGRLTKNPEINYTPNGNPFTDFSIAVECGRKKNGDRITNFFKIEAWSGTAEFICKYFEKGQQIIIDGRLVATSYTDKKNNKRKDVFVLVESVSFCGAKSPEAQEQDFEKSFDDDMEALG